MLVVNEGSTACLCGGVLGASDPDTPPDQLTFHVETPPVHGFLENTLPAPGSEKSNAGVRVGQCAYGGGSSHFIGWKQVLRSFFHFYTVHRLNIKFGWCTMFR